MIEFVGVFDIVLGVLFRFWPVWLALAVVMVPSYYYKEKLGLYGQLYDSGVGIAGLAICLFWLFTAVFASTIAPFNPLQQFVVMKDALPGAIEPESGQAFLLGGDKLARDVFSRMVYGSQIVLIIAPAATGFALMVGVTLGLPAGYYGGRIDSVLSFLANLVLAFPVILLFYLLVTPGIMDTPIPYGMAGLFFLFPIVFFVTLFWTRYKNRPDRLYILLPLTIVIGGWIYAGLVFDADHGQVLRPLGFEPAHHAVAGAWLVLVDRRGREDLLVQDVENRVAMPVQRACNELHFSISFMVALRCCA